MLAAALSKKTDFRGGLMPSASPPSCVGLQSNDDDAPQEAEALMPPGIRTRGYARRTAGELEYRQLEQGSQVVRRRGN